VERSAPPRRHAWRGSLARLHSRLPEFDWRARWEGLEQTWKQLAPAGPTLPQALVGAAGALLLWLACAGLGLVRLVPPPGWRAPASTVAIAAVRPDRVPDMPAEPPPVEVAPVESAQPGALETGDPGPAAVEPLRPASTAAKHRRRQKSRAVRHHQ